ncbi:hypothetical protein SPBRAN_913 [uncultured Candidatus Thioglobus sp.]|nr:hypothetical protein SPBRAN_913 [uncultured Candidatus Thioglobus sp.]
MKCHLIHKDSIDTVLDKARQYRSLLEPELAISICLDVFAVDENNQAALVIYILAMTDLHTHTNVKVPTKNITDSIAKLKSEFERTYYTGITLERKARALMKNAMSRSFAYNLFVEATKLYDAAQQLAPKHCDDSILRYNACVRTIASEHLSPRQDMDDVSWEGES